MGDLCSGLLEKNPACRPRTSLTLVWVWEAGSTGCTFPSEVEGGGREHSSGLGDSEAVVETPGRAGSRWLGWLLPLSGSFVEAELILSWCERSWGGTQEAWGPLQGCRQERVALSCPLGDISLEVGVG